MDQESLSKGHPSAMAIASLLRLAAALDAEVGNISYGTDGFSCTLPGRQSRCLSLTAPQV